MKSIFKRSTLALSLAALFILTFTSSCHRNKDCTAVIHVVDDAGDKAMGAEVRLWANITNPKPGEIEDIQTTGASGTTTHVFKLPAIFDIEVTHSTTGKTGKGIIQLEIGETVEKTVTIK